MNLKHALDTYFSWISKLGILLIVLSSFFLFTNLTTEFYDTAKFLVLLMATGLLLIILMLRFTVSGKVVFVRTPLDIPLLLLLATAIVSTVLSTAPYVALLGNQLKIHTSLVSLITYVVFYFVLINTLKSVKDVKSILFITAIGAGLLSVITLLAYAGVKILPAPWNHGVSFTPTGSSFSTTAVLALLVPVVTSQIISGGNLIKQIINSLLLALFGITIVLTGSWVTWTAALIGLTLVLVTSRFLERITQLKPLHLIAFALPIVAIVLVTILSFVPPIGRAGNPIYNLTKNFPPEAQPDFISSWKISVSAFRDAPFWGTSPASYLFDFTNYKPLEYNSTKNWNLRFDSAFNEYLQVLATLGGIGLIALLSLTALYVTSAYPSLIMRRSYTDEPSDLNLKRALAISGLVFFIILALHTSTLVMWVLGLVILASYMIINLPGGENAQRSWGISGDFKHTLLKIAGNISSTNSSTETVRVEALPSILLTISVALILFTFFFAGKFALADYHHRKALNAVAQNQGLLAYNELVSAEKLNAYNDSYHTDLAQTNFALANAIALAKGPTEASPAGTFTDQDKQNIQILLQQSVNEARLATTLSPRSSLNWEILGLLYRQIAGVAQNALVFSLDSYGRAIFQDPLNPQLRLNVGGIYYAIQNYDLAIRFFTDAINLKPDFANGYYNLSVALRDKGDLNSAQVAAEKVLTLVEINSQDYKVAIDYLDDLKKKINPPTPAEPPAAQASGALQNEKLPKVVNVGNPPEKIATPSAVKKPNSTPEPTATPTP